MNCDEPYPIASAMQHHKHAHSFTRLYISIGAGEAETVVTLIRFYECGRALVMPLESEAVASIVVC